MTEEWQQRMVACVESQEAKDVRMEEALAIKYENRPSSVFKYREINERSRRNLEDDLVWVGPSVRHRSTRAPFQRRLGNLLGLP